MNYKAFTEDNFQIIDKNGLAVPFLLNEIQTQYLTVDCTNNDLVLKARQQGFSSIIEARQTADFLTLENSQSVVLADIADNAIARLDQVKFFIKSYEEKNKVKVPLKYNSKYELFNEAMNSKYYIGTGENVEFGRSRTITNLHISEAGFIPHFRRLLAGALQALVPDGYCVIETTANGFNEFKEFWDESSSGVTGFKPLFYPASRFYTQGFLEAKRGLLGRLFAQEYPESAQEAFLSTGEKFFDSEALKYFYDNSKEPIGDSLVY